MEEEGGVELDVGLQAATGLVLFEQAQRDCLHAARQVVQRVASAEHRLRRGGQDVGARIADFVDAVAEAHQPLARLDLPAQHLLGARDLGDLEDHVERGTGRAAVQRPFQCADGARDRGDEVRSGRCDDARGEGRGIEAVIDDGVEVGLQPADAPGQRRFAGEHVEVIRGMAEVRARRDRCLAVQKAPVGGDDGGEGGEEIARRVVVVLAGERRRRHAQRVHRIDATFCCSVEQIERHGIELTPPCQVVERSELAVPEKVRRLLERCVQGQLRDGVAGNDQLALLAVHHAQFGLCCYDAFQPAHA